MRSPRLANAICIFVLVLAISIIFVFFFQMLAVFIFWFSVGVPCPCSPGPSGMSFLRQNNAFLKTKHQDVASKSRLEKVLQCLSTISRFRFQKQLSINPLPQKGISQ